LGYPLWKPNFFGDVWTTTLLFAVSSIRIDISKIPLFGRFNGVELMRTVGVADFAGVDSVLGAGEIVWSDIMDSPSEAVRNRASLLNYGLLPICSVLQV
jgi:hypothetical protein